MAVAPVYESEDTVIVSVRYYSHAEGRWVNRFMKYHLGLDQRMPLEADLLQSMRAIAYMVGKRESPSG
jgi:hypothetical protein